jgi:hypothetical protein
VISSRRLRIFKIFSSMLCFISGFGHTWAALEGALSLENAVAFVRRLVNHAAPAG